MNQQEQTLIDDLFARLRSAETASGSRDAAAEAYINQLLHRQPAAAYYMAQSIVVQETAVKQLDQQVRERDEQIRQLQAQLQQAGNTQAPSSGGGFLSGLFGQRSAQSAPQPQPQPTPAASGGWRDSGYVPPAAPPVPAAPARSSGFLGGALQTAAGVAGGVMLAQGISSLFSHHNAPEQIVEVIHDSPLQSYQNDEWSSRDQGFSSDDGGFFDDDDSFV